MRDNVRAAMGELVERQIRHKGPDLLTDELCFVDMTEWLRYELIDLYALTYPEISFDAASMQTELGQWLLERVEENVA